MTAIKLGWDSHSRGSILFIGFLVAAAEFRSMLDRGRFPFNPKVLKFRLVHQKERTISVWSARNIRDQLWRWSTVTGLVISVGRTAVSLCCPQYRSFLSCLQEQVLSSGKWSAVSKAWHLKQFESVAIFFDFWYLPLTVSNNWRNTTRGWKKCVKSSYSYIKVRENQRGVLFVWNLSTIFN